MKKILPLLLVLISTQVQASDSTNDSDGMSYESIIGQLSQTQSRVDVKETDPLDSVKIHLGVGVTTTLFTLPHLGGGDISVNQRGYEASLGIDLFSEHWIAEGSVVSYGETKYERARVGLREFDMRLIYNQSMSRSWGLKAGGGLAARYLKVRYDGVNQSTEREYTTPSSLFFGGIEVYLSSKFSIGAEVATRNTLIDETPDQSALDLAVKLDGRF